MPTTANSTMKAAYCYGYTGEGSSPIANYELRSCPRPSLHPSPALRNENTAKSIVYPPGTALVKTIATSICGSDLFGAGGCPSNPNWRRPTDLLATMQERCGGSGHEAIGEIVDMIPHVDADDATLQNKTQLAIGMEVLAMPSSYLYKIAALKIAFEQQTNRRIEDVFPQETGSFCEYFISHECVCIPLPESVPRDSFDHRWYVMAQPLGTILHALAKLGSVINQTIAVVGQGQNGLIITQMLSQMGAKYIIVLDLLQERLQHSKKNGATHTIQVSASVDEDAIRDNIRRITGGKLCDVTIDMVGHQNKTVQLCSHLTKDGGKVLLFGLPPAKNEEPMSIRYVDLSRNLQYICSHSPEFDMFELALRLIERGTFDPGLIFSHEISFQRDFVKAYDMACNYKNGVVKILLTFDE